MMVLLLLTSSSWVRCADTQETDIESMLFFKALYPLQNEIAEEPVSGIVEKGFFFFFFTHSYRVSLDYLLLHNHRKIRNVGVFPEKGFCGKADGTIFNIDEYQSSIRET